MITEIEIYCIEFRIPGNPRSGISQLGIRGFDVDNDRLNYGSISESKAIQLIESGQYRFFTNASGKAYVSITSESNGRKYLKTHPDNLPYNNLINLPICKF